MSAAEINWTGNQEKAITTSGTNVLVSAAAGSGKTTVLVERVIRMLTRAEDPVDIDRLLIMTFTKAAAASMREKIYKAIRAKLDEDPSDRRLHLQLAKLQMAHISTIDSFCADIVKENFQDIDIDPGFRLADEAEIRLLKQDVLKEILEKHYQEPEENFVEFVQSYTDKNDAKLETLILSLFDFAESHPAPKEWLRQSIRPYHDAETLCADYDPEQNAWLDVLAETLYREFDGIRLMAEEGLKIARMNYGPFVYEEPFRKILDFLEDLEGQPCDNRKSRLEEELDNWKASPRVSKKDEVDEDLKNLARDLRADIKKKLTGIRDTWFYQDLESMYRDMASCLPVARTLFDLTVEFYDAFRQSKKEKKIADFSDIAHYALEILVEYEEDGSLRRDEAGKPVCTAVADQMALSFDEIIVDEYQDTNLLQECLVEALSQERFGNPDVFMVGDVKQSIYGFRMACPQLFIQKYDGYRNGSMNGQLIILDNNFRSREEILTVTNRVFEKAMIREIGGIEYNEGHALTLGREGGEKVPGGKYVPEVLMIEGSGEQAKQSEAYEVACRIEKLVREEGFDYKDIVILSRTTNNPAIEKMLTAHGIPLIKSAKKGFFDSFEIRLILDLLTVIDNPYQDIPLAAVLMSPICNVSAEGLAQIRIGQDKGGSLYDAMLQYAPLRWFAEKLKVWKERQIYMEIGDFLDHVLEDSGLQEVLLAMPNGENRKANLDFLKEKTRSFANGPYSGLFHFIRFIKELKEVNVDYGQAQVASEAANAVQMMTIHGSKGLEFPVVFLVSAGKGMNEADLRNLIILDRELGVGIELRDRETRMRQKSLLMNIIRKKKRVDQYAEELRLLYVAMTRAQDKLIITGTDKNLSKHLEKWKLEALLKNPAPAGFKILSAGTYQQLLGLTLFGEETEDCALSLKIAEDVLAERAEELTDDALEKEKILSLISDRADISELKAGLEQVYPFGKATQIQAKISPSQLEEEPKERQLSEEVPRSFAGSDGLERGNAYHRFLELFDYGNGTDPEEQIRAFAERGLLSERAAELVDPEKIRAFLRSNLGQRMKRAFENGSLVREQSFLMGVETDINHSSTLTGIEATSDLPDPEILMVQGVIDAYFEEDGQIILVDYKTDRCAEEEELKERYRPQQEAYADALRKLFGRPVAEKYLYSFGLGREIQL